jgi:hypothetical protein
MKEFRVVKSLLPRFLGMVISVCRITNGGYGRKTLIVIMGKIKQIYMYRSKRKYKIRLWKRERERVD